MHIHSSGSSEESGLDSSNLSKWAADTDSPWLSKDNKDKWVVASYTMTLTLRKTDETG